LPMPWQISTKLFRGSITSEFHSCSCKMVDAVDRNPWPVGSFCRTLYYAVFHSPCCCTCSWRCWHVVRFCRCGIYGCNASSFMLFCTRSTQHGNWNCYGRSRGIYFRVLRGCKNRKLSRATYWHRGWWIGRSQCNNCGAEFEV
jgi:hypothetical protein